MKNSFTTYRAGLLTLFQVIAGIILISFPAQGGVDRKASFRYDNLERTYHVYIPSVYNESARLPMVIALHGRGGNGESMILVTRKGFNTLADKDGFIVVYPDGIDMNWNDGRMDEEARDRPHRENIDDVGFISALIDSMIRTFHIDKKRVYVTGISNGAIMSYRLACELSLKIAAIAPVDGNIPVMLLHQCSPAMPVSVLAINNVNDPLVPYDGGNIYSSIRKLNLGKVLSVNESVSFWVKRDQCSDTPVVTEEPDLDPDDGTRVTRKNYHNNKDGSEVILYSIDGGGHTWPGGFQYLPSWLIGKTSKDINACEVIWRFFKLHSR